MNFHIKRNTGVLLSFLLAFGLMLVWYGTYIIHNDHYFINIYGDGFKNYYTFAYYVAYDHGSHFSGMNYPFGEHVVFTDNQPLLAFVFKYLAHISFVKQHLHSFFTIWLFMSIPICAAVVYLILDEFATGGIYGIISAVFIALLSPQIIRLNAHFGLSYCFFIPLAFFLLIKAYHTRRDFYIFLLIIAVTSFGFLHIYHLAMISCFVLLYAALYYLVGVKSRANTVLFLKLFFASLLPLLLLKTFMFFTDTITDRPESPWGFFSYYASFITVFISPHSFLYEFLTRYISIPYTDVERWAYIGIVADVILVLIIFTSLFKYALTKRIFRQIPHTLNVAFAVSVLVLIFSFGVPFVIPGCEKWLDYTGPLRQFRAPCRFAWVFYYVANIFVVVYAARMVSVLTYPRTTKIVLALIFFTLWFIDLNVCNNLHVREMVRYSSEIDSKEENEVKRALKEKGFTANNFQAALLLSYFNVGSEKSGFSTWNDYWGMRISLYTGLKLVNIALSRTSLAQTDMNIQLFSSDLLKKEVILKYPSRLPLLLIVKTDESHTDREMQLMERANLICSTTISNQPFRFYSLPLSAFADTAAVVLSHLADMQSNMKLYGEYYTTDTNSRIVSSTYDDKPAPVKRFGGGALYLEHENPILYNNTLPDGKDNSWYEFSIWNYGDSRVSGYPHYSLEVYNKQGQQIAVYKAIGNESMDIFEKWVRVSIKFILPAKECVVKISAEGKYATYDELMIKPLTANILTHTGDSTLFMYNNYPIIKNAAYYK